MVVSLRERKKEKEREREREREREEKHTFATSMSLTHLSRVSTARPYCTSDTPLERLYHASNAFTAPVECLCRAFNTPPTPLPRL